MINNFIELWTYGNYDSLNGIDFGISFEVPEDWLINKIKEYEFDNLDSFLDEYIWDTSEFLHNEAMSEKVINNRKSGMFGHNV